MRCASSGVACLLELQMEWRCTEAGLVQHGLCGAEWLAGNLLPLKLCSHWNPILELSTVIGWCGRDQLSEFAT